MNLEELNKHVRAVKEYEWCGQKLLLRKLSAKDHCELFGRIKDEAGKDHTPESDRHATLKYHIALAVRSVANADGELIWDNETGRATLEQCGFDDLVSLGDLVLQHSGYNDQKKS